MDREIALNQFGQLSSYHINVGTISRIYISFKQTYRDSVPFELSYNSVSVEIGLPAFFQHESTQHKSSNKWTKMAFISADSLSVFFEEYIL